MVTFIARISSFQKIRVNCLVDLKPKLRKLTWNFNVRYVHSKKVEVDNFTYYTHCLRKLYNLPHTAQLV